MLGALAHVVSARELGVPKELGVDTLVAPVPGSLDLLDTVAVVLKCGPR